MGEYLKGCGRKETWVVDRGWVTRRENKRNVDNAKE
jgi:hypothetical protein